MRKTLALLLIALLLPLLAGCASRGLRPPRDARAVERVMTVTAYCDCGKCCNWKRNWLFQPVIATGPNKGEKKKVGQTASGRQAKERRTIAADTRYYPFGTMMEVPGWGVGVVEDRGSAIKGEHIDLFFDDHDDALRWGKKRLPVTVYYPR